MTKANAFLKRLILNKSVLKNSGIYAASVPWEFFQERLLKRPSAQQQVDPERVAERVRADHERRPADFFHHGLNVDFPGCRGHSDAMIAPLLNPLADRRRRSSAGFP
ncbi:hypothetical protein QWY84_16770 [Aquisalimonas lutea]|uniref:hypothetical protein n=1 Tax=Aquisalimonas lutea TaxID=1327750 RepID=UPI0025B52DCF|nr:hypothetical protein [Aquisalimonas lutea]MDN3519270.1 hypothetical protein [Aquisalimonas lutea]